MIREALAALRRALRGTWDELYALALANALWFAGCVLPLLLPQLVPTLPAFALAMLLSLAGLAVLTPALAAVAHGLARGHTFGLGDFGHALRRHAGRGALWLLANLLVNGLIVANLLFYPRTFEGPWVPFVVVFWLAVGALWAAAQLYFWPLLLEQETPRLLRCWRNAVLLVLANPFYALFLLLLTLLILALSTLIVMPLVLGGVGLAALLASHATLTLLARHGLIADYGAGRPPAPADPRA